MSLPRWGSGSDGPTISGEAAEHLEQEKQRVAQSIGNVQTEDKQPSDAGPIKVGPKTGKALKYTDEKGNVKHYKGRGRQHQKVKDYYAGNLESCEPVTYNYGMGTITDTPKYDDNGVPLDKNSPEYQERWKAAKEATQALIQGPLQTAFEKRNNGMDKEEMELGVIMCTPCMFKYWGYAENNPEIMAAAWFVPTLMDHSRYKSPITGEYVDKETFQEHNKMKQDGIVDSTAVSKDETKSTD